MTNTINQFPTLETATLTAKHLVGLLVAVSLTQVTSMGPHHEAYQHIDPIFALPFFNQGCKMVLILLSMVYTLTMWVGYAADPTVGLKTQ